MYAQLSEKHFSTSLWESTRWTNEHSMLGYQNTASPMCTFCKVASKGPRVSQTGSVNNSRSHGKTQSEITYFTNDGQWHARRWCCNSVCVLNHRTIEHTIIFLCMIQTWIRTCPHLILWNRVFKQYELCPMMCDAVAKRPTDLILVTAAEL